MRRWLSVAILWGLLLGGFSAQADTNTGLAWLARQTRADGAYSGATDLAPVCGQCANKALRNSVWSE